MIYWDSFSTQDKEFLYHKKKKKESDGTCKSLDYINKFSLLLLIILIIMMITIIIIIIIR